MTEYEIIVAREKLIVDLALRREIKHHDAIELLMERCHYGADEARRYLNRELCGND
jgi:hypothetical protein